MKLRNKKTGEIRKAEAQEDGIYLWDEQTKHWWIYELDMLARGWEYYVEPKEPLIKDEKVRKAVRYWLKCNSGKLAKVFCKNNRTVFIGAYGETLTFDHALDFNDAEMYFSLGDRWFSIDELCGEEEE